MVTFCQVKWAPIEEGTYQRRSGGLEDLERALPFLAAVGPHEVEVVPVGSDFGPEVGGTGEGLAVEELIFDEAVDGFDVALPGVALGRDVTVVGAQGAHGGGEALFLLVFEELRAIVGLPGQAGQIDSVAGQVNGELFGQEGGIGFREFIGIAGEAGTGDRLAGGVLEARQFESCHRGPVMGDILEVLGIRRELAKESPVAFDRAKLLFGGVLLFARAGQLVLAQDAGDGVMTAGQSELVFEALRAEAGLLAQFNDLAFQADGDLVRAALGSAGPFVERGRLAGLVTTQPLADCVTRAAELADGSFEAVGTSEGDQFLVQPMSVGAHAIELKVGAVHPEPAASFGPGPFGPQLRRPRVPLAALGGKACEPRAPSPSLPAPMPPVFGPHSAP